MARPALAPQPQRHRTEMLVQAWLKERQQLLALLCALPDTHDSGDRDNPALHGHIQDLCQTLMDYISAGYFEVYRELAIEAREQPQADTAWLQDVLQRLDDSTDAALDFNEHYDQALRQQRSLAELPEKMAALFEKLEYRFTLEDQLITSVHLQGSHPVTRIAG